MKKLFLVALTVLAFNGLSAQIKIEPGVRGGLSYSGISDFDGDSRSSFYLGADVNFRFAKWFALQPEINYSRQGMEVMMYDNYDPLPAFRKETWELDYLGLTMSNKFFVFRGLNLQLSPYLDFLVNHRNVSPKNDVDTGINLGIGYDFKNGLGIEARVKAGGVDIFDDYWEDYDDDDYSHYNNAFQIGITYSFDLKKK